MKSANTKKRKTPDWVFLLEESVKHRARTPEGEGWSTFAEILESLKGRVAPAYLHRLLVEARRAGTVEQFVGLMPHPKTGRLYRCVWYRRLDGKKFS